MEQNTIGKRLQNWLGTSKKEKFELLNPEEFKSLIRRERCKADRFNQYFSLATVEFDSLVHGVEVKQELLKSFLTHCREYDEFGWIDIRTIGIMLYSSTHDEAQIFINRIQLIKDLHLPHSIFTFPDNWIERNTHIEAQSFPHPTDEEKTPQQNTSEAETEQSASFAVNEEVLRLEATPLPLWKRSLDIASAATLLLVLTPLMALIAATIKLVSKGPIFYSQKRIGYNGREFDFYKFRTMKINNDCGQHKALTSNMVHKEVPMTKLYNDPRIILFGKLIRNTSLDELPQLFNVLKGDMSLVGPRPCLPYEAKLFKRWQKQRFYSIPGLTGLWQVSGKNRLTFNQMVRLDISYYQHLSIFQDLKIFIKTPLAIFDEFRQASRQKEAMA